MQSPRLIHSRVQYCILVRNHLQGLVLLCTKLRRWETLRDEPCTFVDERVHLPVREPGNQVDRLQRHDLTSAALSQPQREILFEYVPDTGRDHKSVTHTFGDRIVNLHRVRADEQMVLLADVVSGNPTRAVGAHHVAMDM
jgi:hypothetical protein